MVRNIAPTFVTSRPDRSGSRRPTANNNGLAFETRSLRSAFGCRRDDGGDQVSPFGTPYGAESKILHF